MDRNKPAPIFLNLLQIKLPVGGLTSIAHRISGVILFISIPLVAWLFALSLRDENGYREALHHLGTLPLQVLSVALVWSLSHHLLAGLRHLLLDIDVGVDRHRARRSAWLVNVGALLLAVAFLMSRL
jgi:succinate dehydrogenase / fumarate reductase cytochrome b subunit